MCIIVWETVMKLFWIFLLLFYVVDVLETAHMFPTPVVSSTMLGSVSRVLSSFGLTRLCTCSVRWSSAQIMMPTLAVAEVASHVEGGPLKPTIRQALWYWGQSNSEVGGNIISKCSFFVLVFTVIYCIGCHWPLHVLLLFSISQHKCHVLTTQFKTGLTL